jgi:hypothetical protein
MSRKEVVLLVSRAFAGIQLVTALIEATYLPERLFSLHHFANVRSVLLTNLDVNYYASIDRIGVVSLIARIVGLLILTVVFWRCGHWVERVLLPSQDA